MKKYFIITIDTEGDNIWNYKPDNNVLLRPKVENAAYIERFQILCEKYNFCPTYLVDYEMAQSDVFTAFGKSLLRRKKGEIGMHMHAFSTPPFFKLDDKRGKGLAFAGEYPMHVLYKKMEYMTKTLEDKFQIRIASHRGGRWYLDNRIINCLDKLNYLVDCTVTPRVNWEMTKGQTYNSNGSNYTKYVSKPYRIKDTKMWEIPVTIYKCREGFHYKPNLLWMRPDGKNTKKLIQVIKRNRMLPIGYLEFMLHSSELMPGASPTFRTKQHIEMLYQELEIVFYYAYKNGYVGITCSDYVKAFL